VVVRVYFMDDSMKALAVDEVSSAEQLKATVVERIAMKEDSCFAIFEKKDGWERCLEPDEKPCELMTLWSGGDNNTPGKNHASFVFKKKIFLRDDEREMGDPVAKHYVYIQALHSVIESEYPCSVEDSIKLAGLQVQITY